MWVLSQVLLLLYFKLDNGSNVCGIEFNYNNNKEEEKEEVVEETEEGKEKRESEEDSEFKKEEENIIDAYDPNKEAYFQW